MYTTVPPPDRFVLGHKQSAAADKACAWLPSVTLSVGALLDFHWLPAALWSIDHTECLFNGAMSTLSGFCDMDFSADDKLWLARIDARDRASFLSAWKNLQHGETKITCRYRFMPRHGGLGIELEESALLLPSGKAAKRAVLSLYRSHCPAAGQEGGHRGGRSPVCGLIHQIGNNLQAIRSEAELERLFGSLPERSFDNIARGVDSIQKLVAEIEGLTAGEAVPLERHAPSPWALPDEESTRK